MLRPLKTNLCRTGQIQLNIACKDSKAYFSVRILVFGRWKWQTETVSYLQWQYKSVAWLWEVVFHLLLLLFFKLEKILIKNPKPSEEAVYPDFTIWFLVLQEDSSIIMKNCWRWNGHHLKQRNENPSSRLLHLCDVLSWHDLHCRKNVVFLWHTNISFLLL